METTGIALRNPRSDEWLLTEGDQLVNVIGGPTETKWAISMRGNKNGGRDVLIAAHIKHSGMRRATINDTIPSMQHMYSQKVATALEQLLALPVPKQGEVGSPDLAVRAAILAEYDRVRRPAGDADDATAADDKHDFLSERIATLKRADNISLLTDIEIALTVRQWDRAAVFYTEGKLCPNQAVHQPSAVKVPKKSEQQELKDVYFLRVMKPDDWRSLIFLTDADVVIGQVRSRSSSSSSSSRLPVVR